MAAAMAMHPTACTAAMLFGLPVSSILGFGSMEDITRRLECSEILTPEMMPAEAALSSSEAVEEEEDREPMAPSSGSRGRPPVPRRTRYPPESRYSKRKDTKNEDGSQMSARRTKRTVRVTKDAETQFPSTSPTYTKSDFKDFGNRGRRRRTLTREEREAASKVWLDAPECKPTEVGRENQWVPSFETEKIDVPLISTATHGTDIPILSWDGLPQYSGEVSKEKISWVKDCMQYLKLVLASMLGPEAECPAYNVVWEHAHALCRKVIAGGIQKGSIKGCTCFTMTCAWVSIKLCLGKTMVVEETIQVIERDYGWQTGISKDNVYKMESVILNTVGFRLQFCTVQGLLYSLGLTQGLTENQAGLLRKLACSCYVDVSSPLVEYTIIPLMRDSVGIRLVALVCIHTVEVSKKNDEAKWYDEPIEVVMEKEELVWGGLEDAAQRLGLIDPNHSETPAATRWTFARICTSVTYHALLSHCMKIYQSA